MTGLKTDLRARSALRFVLAAGLLLVLAANLPGHLSYDSVAQLYEGHFHVRNTWGPVLYAWILGFFDQFVPGAALYVVVSGLVFFVSLASLTDLRPRTSWLAIPVAAAVIFTPQVLIYQAIVWKDVMFANCGVAGLICVAHAAQRWDRAPRRWALLILAVLLLAAGSQVRQNGIIAAVFAAISLGWIAGRGRWLRGLAWGFGGLACVGAAGLLMTFLAYPAHADHDSGTKTGVRIVQNYDLVGAIAIDPTYRLTVLEKADPEDAEIMRKRAKPDYSGRRVDFIDRDQVITDALWRLPDDVTMSQWLDLVLKHPALYLRVRWEDYRWLIAPPVIDWCLPVYLGVDAPEERMKPLKLTRRFVQTDIQLNNYASWFFDTPVFSHAVTTGICLLLGGVFLWRRSPADIALAGLQFGGAAFAASFFLITIACDYRYLYFTDLAALTGLIYFAIDPSFRRRPKAA